MSGFMRANLATDPLWRPKIETAEIMRQFKICSKMWYFFLEIQCSSHENVNRARLLQGENASDDSGNLSSFALSALVKKTFILFP